MLRRTFALSAMIFWIAGCAYLGGAATSSPSAQAAAACSGVVGVVPAVQSTSPAVLAAAFAVTGAQYAAFQEKSVPGMVSQWADKPAAAVFVCFLDGDFTLTTPGPPGHDTSAQRIVVSVSDGMPELFLTAKTKADLPITNPAGQ